MPARFSRRFVLIWGLLLLSAWPLPIAAQAPQAPPPAEKMAAPLTSPDALPRIFREGAASLEKEVAALKTRAEAAQKEFSQEEKEARERQVSLAALKTSLAVKNLPLSQAEEAVKSLPPQEEKLGQQHQELLGEIDRLTKEQTAKAASRATLQEEVTRLQAAKHPVTRLREFQQSYKKYQTLAAAGKQAAAQVLESLQKRAALLETERQVLTDIRGELQKYVDETWKAELLKRQAPVSFREQGERALKTFQALPGQVSARFLDLAQSGRLKSFFLAHLAPLIGLLASIILLRWGAGRVAALIMPSLTAWQARAEARGLKVLLNLGQILAAHLFSLGLMVWMGLAVWILGFLQVPWGRFLLYLVIVVVGLRLGCRLAQILFAGEAAGGLLALDPATARFYRRYLKLFLLYFAFGTMELLAAELFDFHPTSRQLLRHFFEVGLLGWALWLLRRPYLSRLLPELPGPDWLRRMGVMRLLRGLVLLLLSLIILASLLGFQNLSAYVTRAAALTGVALLGLWALWQTLETLLHYLLHPQQGWAARQYPGQRELLARYWGPVRQGLGLGLVAAALLAVLSVWGLEAGRLLRTFAWLTWGPVVGPVRLSPLNLGLTALVIYLGRRLSRLGRSLMEARVYPRTGWDAGIQYTISTSLHYAILILTGLLALNILGFPLTNLALVAGALGVGIGFGLQNIVNNFISGLILLFERPIKVGDILVIDGQWGKVKEIRVRSTVFETYDRYVLIIPNSELLSGKILNWTHFGPRPTRLSLEVGVGYGADVRLVTRVLLDAARANPRVLKDPPPTAFFRAFGDSALNFTLRVFLNSLEERTEATHELNSAIFKACQEHGIEIPFPQRDLYIKNWPASLGGGEE